MSAPASQILDPAEPAVIRRVFEDIKNVISSLVPSGVPASFSENIRELVEYNSYGGKQIRLRMTIAAFKHFAPNATSNEMYLAHVFGWIIEIFQGAACIIDDVVDEGTHRRGKVCWNKLPRVGLKSIIDSHIMVSICDLLLQHYFGREVYYLEMITVFNQVKWISLLGESMESIFTENMPMEMYTIDLYRKICYGRTSCYTFYFPVAAALTMVPDYDLDNKVLEEAASMLGFLYSVQDDFLDVFGDPLKTGKIGTDIQGRKCTWLIVTALEKADATQKQILMRNFGQHKEECVAQVIQIFEDLKIQDAFRELTAKTEIKFTEMLMQMPATAPVQLYLALLVKLVNREH